MAVHREKHGWATFENNDSRTRNEPQLHTSNTVCAWEQLNNSTAISLNNGYERSRRFASGTRRVGQRGTQGIKAMEHYVKPYHIALTPNTTLHGNNSSKIRHESKRN